MGGSTVNTRWRQYLEAMGIQPWQLRRPELLMVERVAEPVATGPAAAQPPAAPAGADEATESEPAVPVSAAAAVVSATAVPESAQRPETESPARIPSATNAAADTAGTSPVATSEAQPEPKPKVEPDTAPVSRPATQARVGPEPQPAALPDAGGDPYADYDQWAALAEQQAGDDFFLDPDEPEPDPRPARIAAMDWDELVSEVSACQACALHASRTNPVFGVGNRQADWFVVGEAPGADEDRLGEPFVGRAGKLLDAMLKAIGLDRRTVFIGNVLKSRPPRNRDPQPEEIAACRPFLDRQIQLVRPRLVLVVGRIAAQALLETDQAVGRLRGRVHRFGPHRLPLVVTYHPAYLLRSPREKRRVWDDLQLARRALGESGS